MKVKVYLNRIKVYIKDDFDRAGEYFARHGLPIEFEFINSDIKGYKVVTENFGSVGYRQQITGHEKLIPLSNDYITIFAFNGNEYPLQKIPTSKCGTFPNGVLVTLMTYKEGDVVGETYSTLIHELMHALFWQLRKRGVNLEDPMDIFFKDGKWLQYYKNDQPEAIDSNFGEAWKRLTPWIPLLSPKLTVESTLVVKLTRDTSTAKETTGTLKFDGFICKTLELPWVNNYNNISCIPKGTYQVKWTLSPKFRKYTYEVQNVPKRSGIRIHSTNYYYELKGCIALGDKLLDINKDGQLDTVNSRITIKKFETILNKRPFTLIIE